MHDLSTSCTGWTAGTECGSSSWWSISHHLTQSTGKVLGNWGKVVISAHFFGLEKENAPLLKRRIRQLGQVIDFLIRIMAMLQ